MEARAMSSKASKEADLQKAYDDRISEIRERVFGVHGHGQQEKAERVLAQPLKGQEIASWYFLPPQEIPGFHNEDTQVNSATRKCL